MSQKALRPLLVLFVTAVFLLLCGLLFSHRAAAFYEFDGIVDRDTGLHYTVSDGEAKIVYCYPLVTGELIVPDTLGGYPVTAIDESALAYLEYVQGITIPDSVTHIGKEAFSGCYRLKSITLGKGITFVGEDAFSACPHLTDVFISDLAAWCNIEFESFFSSPTFCKNFNVNGAPVTKLVIPDGVTEIKDFAFFGQDSITEIVVPDGVTSIGRSSLSSCHALTKCTLPSSVTSFGDYALAHNEKLTCVTLPGSFVQRGENIFKGSSNITELIFADGTESIDDAVGLLYGMEKLTAITVPEGVEEIPSFAFFSCEKLTSVKLPQSLLTVGEAAFSYCSALETLDIPKNVTEIYTDSFVGCSSLTSVRFHGSERPDAKIGHWYGSSFDSSFFVPFEGVRDDLVFFFPFEQTFSSWRGVRVEEFYEESEDTSSDLTEGESSSALFWILLGTVSAVVLVGGTTVLCLLLRKKGKAAKQE